MSSPQLTTLTTGPAYAVAEPMTTGRGGARAPRWWRVQSQARRRTARPKSAAAHNARSACDVAVSDDRELANPRPRTPAALQRARRAASRVSDRTPELLSNPRGRRSQSTVFTEAPDSGVGCAPTGPQARSRHRVLTGFQTSTRGLGPLVDGDAILSSNHDPGIDRLSVGQKIRGRLQPSGHTSGKHISEFAVPDSRRCTSRRRASRRHSCGRR